MYLIAKNEDQWDDKSRDPIAIATDLDEVWVFANEWVRGRRVMEKYPDLTATLEAQYVPTVQTWETRGPPTAPISLAWIHNRSWKLYERK